MKRLTLLFLALSLTSTAFAAEKHPLGIVINVPGAHLAKGDLEVTVERSTAQGFVVVEQSSSPVSSFQLEPGRYYVSASGKGEFKYALKGTKRRQVDLIQPKAIYDLVERIVLVPELGVRFFRSLGLGEQMRGNIEFKGERHMCTYDRPKVICALIPTHKQIDLMDFVDTFAEISPSVEQMTSWKFYKEGDGAWHTLLKIRGETYTLMIMGFNHVKAYEGKKVLGLWWHDPRDDKNGDTK